MATSNMRIRTAEQIKVQAETEAQIQLAKREVGLDFATCNRIQQKLPPDAARQPAAPLSLSLTLGETRKRVYCRYQIASKL